MHTTYRRLHTHAWTPRILRCRAPSIGCLVVVVVAALGCSLHPMRRDAPAGATPFAGIPILTFPASGPSPYPAAVGAAHGMSDDELLVQYIDWCRHGWTGKPTGVIPWPDSEPKGWCIFVLIRAEIASRGARMEPALIRLLREEVLGSNNAPRESDPAPCWDSYSGPMEGVGHNCGQDVLDLLAHIQDPRAAPTLLEIMEGMGGKASVNVQAEACDLLQHLTYCSYDAGRFGFRYGAVDEVPRTGAGPPVSVNLRDFRDHKLKAAFFRCWLNGEGRDPVQAFAKAAQAVVSRSFSRPASCFSGRRLGNFEGRYSLKSNSADS